jgi:ribonuclease D
MMMNNDDEIYLSISKDTLNELPISHFSGNIIVVDSEDKVPIAIESLRKHKILGFDTETRPSFKKGVMYKVSLIQLSTESECFLFRINLTGFHPDLKTLLEDESILKIGASVHDDFLNLSRLEQFNPAGFIDIQQYVKQFLIEDNSLSRIYAVLFGKRISKGQRLTNWESANLTMSQQSYAALDAQACLRIYNYLHTGAFEPLKSKYLCVREKNEELPNDEKN